MKKFASLILIFVLTTTLFIGCSKTQETNTDTPETKAETESKVNETSKADEDNKKESKETETITEEVANIDDIDFSDFILENTDETVTYKDPFDEEVTVKKNPEKVVVLMNSLLDLWYLSGGEAVARVSGKTNVPEAAMDIEQVGSVNAPSIEKIIALEPDLVILSSERSSHKELKELLQKNDIPTMYVSSSTEPYDKFVKCVKLFTTIMGNEDIFDTTIKDLIKQVSDICEKAKEQDSPKVATLFGSSKYVKAELPISLVGEMVKMLGATNIVEDVPVATSTKVDFSLEKLIQEDPEYIFISSMGKLDAVKERIKNDLESNEAWSSLSAVQNDKVYYLPTDLFFYKPNARYAEAFEYLAKIIYPEVFK